jgi:hypothetical protein
MKGKKLIFSPEATKIEKPKRPLTRSAMKKLTSTYEAPSYHEAEEIVGFQPPSGKRVMFSQEALEKEKSSILVTKSTTRKLVHDEDIRYEILSHCVAKKVVETQSPSEENNMTINRLIKQLKEAQGVIVQLREENRKMKRKIA